MTAYRPVLDGTPPQAASYNKTPMRAATVVHVSQDLFYVLLHVLFHLWSLLESERRIGLIIKNGRSVLCRLRQLTRTSSVAITSWLVRTPASSRMTYDGSSPLTPASAAAGPQSDRAGVVGPWIAADLLGRRPTDWGGIYLSTRRAIISSEARRSVQCASKLVITARDYRRELTRVGWLLVFAHAARPTAVPFESLQASRRRIKSTRSARRTR